MHNKNVEKYVNAKGDFEFPKFLYHKHNSLMKSILDLGNLACSDSNQLRAFKERVKKDFKATWQEYADLLEAFDFVTPCSCADNEYCRICGGSRFVTNDLFNSDEIQESVAFVAGSVDDKMMQRLNAGLIKAVMEKEKLDERD